MYVHNRHSRDLPAPPEWIGALIDGLGGEDDRLWPAERWPATPFELDGPLAVGTVSRQGLLRQTRIRQTIEEYEPGRRLVFRFAPGLGLTGTHRVEVEPLGADRTRLTHTLECRVEPKLIPVYPILIRQHDALVEDLLDGAELATTGRVARPARWPLSVRLVNAIEVAIARRQGKLPSVPRPRRRLAEVSGIAVPALLASIAALHAAWALGWYWPAGSESELAELVLSGAERDRLGAAELPPVPATWAVAAGLAGAAAVVRAVATGRRSRPLTYAAWSVAGVFAARGLVFIPSDLIGGLEDRYDRLDLALYSPLCLALGAGTALLAYGARSAGPRAAA
jgi:uncharacterized protein DUF3995/polyketide cyclase/dehydrase/lipid transport protein